MIRRNLRGRAATSWISPSKPCSFKASSAGRGRAVRPEACRRNGRAVVRTAAARAGWCRARGDRAAWLCRRRGARRCVRVGETFSCSRNAPRSSKSSTRRWIDSWRARMRRPSRSGRKSHSRNSRPPGPVQVRSMAQSSEPSENCACEVFRRVPAANRGIAEHQKRSGLKGCGAESSTFPPAKVSSCSQSALQRRTRRAGDRERNF